jgi:hypothetical protein
MAHRTLCGIVRKDGRDCPAPVTPGAPLNLCDHHFKQAHDWVVEAAALVNPTELLPTSCPACGVSALVGGVLDAVVTCQACNTTVTRETAPPPASGAYPVEAPPPYREPSPVVYYLRFADRIKIGTTMNLDRRLKMIPHDELLATEPGSFTVETRRHDQFKALRITGEWFRADPRLLSHIASLRKTG